MQPQLAFVIEIITLPDYKTFVSKSVQSRNDCI